MEAILLRAVTLVGLEGQPNRPRQDVLIRNGRIISVVPASLQSPGPGVRVVNASGLFVIPGLWDMHFHLTVFPVGGGGGGDMDLEHNADVFFPLFLAQGVTGVRDASGELPVLRQWRDAIRNGERVGPRLVITGRKISGGLPVVAGAPSPIRNAADANETMRQLKAGGADFVKIGDTPAEIFPVIIRAATEAGLPVAGHVPADVSAVQASDWGMSSIEHLGGVLTASSTAEPAILAHARHEATWWGRLLLRYERWRPTVRHFERVQMALDSYSDSAAAVAFEHFRRNQTWQVPTLVALQDVLGVGSPDLSTPLETYRPPSLTPLPGEYRTAYTRAVVERLSAKQSDLVRDMANAGVPLLAGTDGPGTRRMPGESLLRELELMVRAGLTPSQALAAATSGPARFLHASDSLGAVAPGYVADLVLLAADPTVAIQNLRQIRGVVVAGRYLSPIALDSMLRPVHDLVALWREHALTDAQKQRVGSH